MRQEKSCYSIAMAIGNSLDLGTMLKEALSAYMQTFSCQASCVLHLVRDREHLAFEHVLFLPDGQYEGSPLHQVVDGIPAGLDAVAWAQYVAGLPAVHRVSGVNHYILELPDFGLLLLARSDPGLSGEELEALGPLNRKLAGACLQCLTNAFLQEKIAEQELVEENYRDIFNDAAEGIFRSTLEGQLVEANPAMVRLLGYDSLDELLQSAKKSVDRFYVHAYDRERFIRRLRRKGRVSGFEMEYWHRDGSTGWGSISARLIRDSHGEPLYIEGSAVDISPKKNAVMALRLAKLEADRLSQMKSNFLSMVSHELRTPLTAILGFAKISQKRIAEIMAGALSSEVGNRLQRIKHNTEVIVTESERLMVLINNVLDLSRLEAGQFEWTMREISMNDVLAQAVEIMRPLFADTDVKFEVSIQADLPSLVGDQDRLVQVVVNLLSNALKFTRQGVIGLSAEAVAEEIVVRVSDTGIGVPENDLEGIFDKFYQLGSVLTDKPKGTGLGLPFCREIVEHHDGRIWAESGEEGGSTFAFLVPIKSTRQ